MTRMDHPFRVSFSNVPTINIRLEYNRYLEYLESGRLLEDLKQEPGYLKTPYMVWLGFPEVFLTMLLQRTISGLEAYLSHAVQFELARRGRSGKQSAAAIESAIASAMGGAAEKLFNGAPSLVERRFAMRQYDGALWGRTKLFYRDIRNPVMHGFQLDGSSIRTFLDAYKHLDHIYDWIDSWNDPEQVLPGFRDMLGRPSATAGGSETG